MQYCKRNLVSFPGVTDVINFRPSLPCEIFAELRKFAQSYVRHFRMTYTQAHNQLGTPGEAKSFLGGAQIF